MTNELKMTEMDQVAGGISPVPVPTTMPVPEGLRRGIVDPIYIIAPNHLPRPGQPDPGPNPAPLSRRRGF